MPAYVTTSMTHMRLLTSAHHTNSLPHLAALKAGLLEVSLPLHPFNNILLFLNTLLNTVTQAKYQE